MGTAPTPTTRLAPSPTGALHLGNARTFLVTWALARARGWRIVLRIEDLDTPRNKPGANEQTIDLLRWLGMDWDVGPIIQSHDRERHEGAVRTLVARGMAYPSNQSRKEVQELTSGAQSAPQEGTGEVKFPASLRPARGSEGWPSEFVDAHSAWRFATPETSVRFVDLFHAEQSITPAHTIGDFPIWTRRSQSEPGQAAYQLAVVVDDAAQRVTHVVRGDDLLDSAARQMLLYDALGLGPKPTYAHLPLVRGEDGRRLAKRHGDTRLDMYRERGVRAEKVIGLCAHWCGLLPRREACSAREFLDAFREASRGDSQGEVRLDMIPRGSITKTAEDDQWLLG